MVRYLDGVETLSQKAVTQRQIPAHLPLAPRVTRLTGAAAGVAAPDTSVADRSGGRPGALQALAPEAAGGVRLPHEAQHGGPAAA